MRADRKTSKNEAAERERKLIAKARRQVRAGSRDETACAKQEADRTSESDPSIESIPPDSFAGYRIIREIHRGGQGVVYQAIQKSTQRKVALKVMKEGPFAGPEDTARFHREVQILGQLQHPNIVAIHDSGQAAGHFFYSMDYIAGPSLQEYMTKGERSVEEILRLIAQICRAVNAAHLRGIVHRDLKPGNICIDPDGQPHILDFGLAKVAVSDAKPSVMTMTGQFLGSLPWASPEQAAGSPSQIDVRSDVYSLGVIVFQMLTGEFPYEVSGDVREVVNRILTAEPARPGTLARRIDRDVETIVLKCLAKERERRYQNAGELAGDIERYLAGEPIQARRDSVVYVARTRLRAAVRRHPAATLALGVLGVFFATHWVMPIIYLDTPLNQYYEQFLAALPTPTASTTFENVRVITITDETDFEQLAQAAGLSGVRKEPVQSLRRLHGALMERLARSGLRTLVWDITFPESEVGEFDAELARGMRRLDDHGVDVIVGIPRWSIAASHPPLCSAIQLYALAGATTAHFGATGFWRVELAVHRDRTGPGRSLVLEAVASYRFPGCELDVVLNAPQRTLEMRYSRRTPGVLRAKELLGYDRIRLTGITPVLADDDEHGFKSGDQISDFQIILPPPDVLERATVSYGDAFAADAAQLRDWFGGRLVIIGYDRDDMERRFAYLDGRVLPGVHGHAAAIDAVLRGAFFRVPTQVELWGIIAGAALLGMTASLAFQRHRIRRVLLLTLLTASICAACILAHRAVQVMMNPLVPIFALTAGGALTTFVRRHARADR